MSNHEPAITADRLQRLRPSDISRMARQIHDDRFAEHVSSIFSEFIARLPTTPTAVDLDDVTRITLQLNKAGFWQRVEPRAFLRRHRATMDLEVQATISDALGIGAPALEPAASTAAA